MAAWQRSARTWVPQMAWATRLMGPPRAERAAEPGQTRDLASLPQMASKSRTWPKADRPIRP
eukprot:scaffold1666_cov424-Prasinococcus_capsulatus_cf.AAC.9